MLAGKKQSFSWHHTEVHTMPMDWCLLFANSLWLHAASQMLVNFVFTVSFHFSFFLSLSLFLSVFLCPDSTHSRSPSTVSWCTLFIWFLLFCYLVSSGASSLFDAAFRSWLCVWCAFFLLLGSVLLSDCIVLTTLEPANRTHKRGIKHSHSQRIYIQTQLISYRLSMVPGKWSYLWAQ